MACIFLCRYVSIQQIVTLISYTQTCNYRRCQSDPLKAWQNHISAFAVVLIQCQENAVLNLRSGWLIKDAPEVLLCPPLVFAWSCAFSHRHPI